MKDLNKLVGIPFKLNRRDWKGCDCRGIAWLYYKYTRDKEYPFTDGKNIFFRNIKKDKIRMLNVIKTFMTPIDVNELQEGDLVIINSVSNIGALGVCINDKQILHMDKVIGSCLTKIRYLKEFILMSYRPND